jgi:hypothetical protein
MNIVTPIPTTVSFVTANVNTEAARRDNTLRETVPATSASENSAAETGVGSEADRVKAPGQPPPPLTYERPQNQSAQNQQADGKNSSDKDNGEDPSAGKENAESRQQEQAEQQELEDLKQRDLEVRSHEQAHASIGGQFAGPPQYEYETGPDGERYAVGGEVSIDISEENTPEETIRKMQQVKAAALAPAEPSPQDLRVATEATQKSVEARNEIIEEKAERLEKAFTEQSAEISTDDKDREASTVEQSIPDLDDIVDGIDVAGVPKRSLDNDPVAEAVGLETGSENFRQALANRDTVITQRVAVIENFYQQISLPRDENLRQSA